LFVFVVLFDASTAVVADLLWCGKPEGRPGNVVVFAVPMIDATAGANVKRMYVHVQCMCACVCRGTNDTEFVA